MSNEKGFTGITFGLDFDGTCVFHSFPEVGEELPGVVDTLRWIIDQGGKIILNTMRSNCPDRAFLDEAVAWFKERGIELYGVNQNPTQAKWTSSPKVYAHYYIDDAALGTPLMYHAVHGNRFYVDWKTMRGILEAIRPEAEAIHVPAGQMITE